MHVELQGLSARHPALRAGAADTLRDITLDVRPGEMLTALWEGEGPLENLREHFNRDVVVEGTGVFRPSGSLLRVDADAIALASSRDEFFRRVPCAPVQHDYRKLARLKAGEKAAYVQLMGVLPAEESDEEFDAALAALR